MPSPEASIKQRVATEVERLKVADRAIQLMVVDPRAQVDTRHVLEPFAALVDPTPRSLKRYVMAYSMLRAVRTAEGSAVKIGPLALWTVVVTRWPMLGDYLERDPEAVRLFKAGDEKAFKRVPPELVSLFTDPPQELLAVINHQAGPLDAKKIRTCSGQGQQRGDARIPYCPPSIGLPTVDNGASPELMGLEGQRSRYLTEKAFGPSWRRSSSIS